MTKKDNHCTDIVIYCEIIFLETHQTQSNRNRTKRQVIKTSTKRRFFWLVCPQNSNSPDIKQQQQQQQHSTIILNKKISFRIVSLFWFYDAKH